MTVDFRFIKKETLDKIANSIRSILDNSNKVNIEDIPLVLENHYNDRVKHIVEADNFADSQSELTLDEKRLKGVTKIGDHALSGWYWLKSIVLPDSVTNIGNHACENVINLENVKIGNGVESIGDYAFSGCTSLNNLTIGSNVKSIGNNAFGDCKQLESVVIPKSVTYIGDRAFSNCTTLQGADTQSVGTVGEAAFFGCNNLKYAWLDYIKSLGNAIFSGCTSLESVSLGDIPEIPLEMFKDCTQLVNVEIYSDQYSIGASAFANCTNLTRSQIDIILQHTTTIGDNAFSNTLNGDILSIPNSVTSIGRNAFANNPTVETVIFGELDDGNKLESIDYGAFSGCPNLSHIWFLNFTSVPNLKTSADDIFSADCEFSVPYSLYDEWITKEYWRDIADRISIDTSTEPTEE